MDRFIKILIFLFSVSFLTIVCEDAEYMLCGDENCKKVISTATSLYRYSAGEKWKISFEPRKTAKILAKYNNDKDNLWKVDIGGRVGWVPAASFQEGRVIVRKDDLIKVSVDPNIVRSKNAKKDEDKVQASEMPTEEKDQSQKSTTPPLPDYTAKEIVTTLNDSTESPVNTKPTANKEIIDGTTVPKEGDISNNKELESSKENILQKESPTSEKEEVIDAKLLQKPTDGLNITLSSTVDNATIDIESHKGNSSDLENEKSSSVDDTKNESQHFKELNNYHKEELSEIKNNNLSAEKTANPENQTNNNTEIPKSVGSEDAKINIDEKSEVVDENSELLHEKMNVTGSNNDNNNNNIPVEGTNIVKPPFYINSKIQIDENTSASSTENEAENTNNTAESFDDKNESTEHIENNVLSETDKEKLEEDTSQSNIKNYSISNDDDQTRTGKNESIDAVNDNVIELKEEVNEKQTEENTTVNEGIYDGKKSAEESMGLEGNIQIENNLNETHTKEKEESLPPSVQENDTNTEIINDDLKDDFDFVENIIVSPPIQTDQLDQSTNNEMADLTESNEPESLTASLDKQDMQNSVPETLIADENFQEDKGLFFNVFENVKKLWSSSSNLQNDNNVFDSDSNRNFDSKVIENEVGDGYCEKATPNACPISKNNKEINNHQHLGLNEFDGKSFIANNDKCHVENDFFSSLADKILDMVDLLIFLIITAATTLVFAFGYYCICHNQKEHSLLSKLNIVERSLLAANKETIVLKHELLDTRSKLSSIEDNSFGSNDMVIALKKELETKENEKLKLKEQVSSLEKELENAAEAGLELNKIVSELLSNQSGDESIISSVEELQKQLNEQQNTILQINTTLAEKSKENSELQLMISEQTEKFQEEVEKLKETIGNLEEDKTKLIGEIEQLQEQHAAVVTSKCNEIDELKHELELIKLKHYEANRKWQSSEAKIEALEDCLNLTKSDSNGGAKDFIDIANLKAEIVVLTRERDSLKERLEGEADARKLLENRVKVIGEEVSLIKQEHNQSEKDKLEAQTRLEVLSSYFKEKEMQLQKELSVKEAMWLKQQGETTSTVERVRSMQDEIQSLKSQNDSLRAEIEAQSAAYKAQIATLENRAHETWLAARHSERKYEEARSEASTLRRKLTSVVGNSVASEKGLHNRIQNSINGITNEINTSSPIHMDSPGSPLLGGLPPPPPFLPPPFMPAPHPFMPMPPPLLPSVEMRPPPLGRLMSPPPPPHNLYSSNMLDEERNRYSPDTYAYDTETDFSLPPSPQARSGGGGGGYSSRERERSRNYKAYSRSPSPKADRNRKSKGSNHSDSEEQFSDW